MRRGLLVLQGAISVVLLIGAGLFVRSFHNVRSLDLGFQPEHVIVAELSARGTPIDSARRIELMDRLRERALTVPGVQHSAHTLTIPFSLEWNQYLVVPGIDTASLRDLFYMNPVGPGYFETMGTPLIRGREITDADRAGGQPVAVLSQAAVRRIWPSEDPLGKCVKLEASGPCYVVVGVAGDIRAGFDEGPGRHVYVAATQVPAPDSRLFIRTRGEAATQAEGVRRALQEVVPGFAYVSVRTLDELVAPQMRSWRLGATMFTIFGAACARGGSGWLVQRRCVRRLAAHPRAGRARRARRERGDGTSPRRGGRRAGRGRGARAWRHGRARAREQSVAAPLRRCRRRIR